jgi:hypothetical protein
MITENAGMKDYSGMLGLKIMLKCWNTGIVYAGKSKCPSLTGLASWNE